MARSGTTVSGIVSRPITVAVLSGEGGEELKGSLTIAFMDRRRIEITELPTKSVGVQQML